MFHLPRAVTTVRRDFTAKFLVCFPEMSSLHTRGRKLKRVAAAQYVDSRVVGPKLGAAHVLMVKNPPLHNFPGSPHCIPLTLLPLQNAPVLFMGSPVSHHHKYWKRGGGSHLHPRGPLWCGSHSVSWLSS